MSFIKTFEQFKSVPLNEAAEPIQVQAKEGELSRWKVVLRSRDEDTISDKNPAQTIARELAEFGGFKKWWNSYIKGIPVEKSLAIIYSGVSGKKNLFGKEVAKAEIAFYPYLRQAQGVQASGGGPAATVSYDVTQAEPVATTQVEGSDVPLMVWHAEDLPKIKINYEPGFIQARDKSNKLINFDLVNPPYMYKNGNHSTGQPASTSQSTQVSQNTSTDQTTQNTSTASPEMIAVTDKFVGLQMNNAFNQLVKDLQEIIIKNGSETRPTDSTKLKDYDTRVSAATKIRTDGGADGLYGNATATAIGVLIGSNQAETTVTKEVADKIAAALTAITPVEASSLIGAVKKSATKGSTGSRSKTGTKKPKPNPGF